jgi:hypothetical protein
VFDNTEYARIRLGYEFQLGKEMGKEVDGLAVR